MCGVGMTRRAALFSFAGVIVIGLFIAGNVGRSLRAELTLDGATYEMGESIEFALTVCSNSVLPMSTDDGTPSWQILDSEGDVVADSSHYVFTLELKNLTWGPRSCRTGVGETWDQRVWNQPTAVPLRPGRRWRSGPRRCGRARPLSPRGEVGMAGSRLHDLRRPTLTVGRRRQRRPGWDRFAVQLRCRIAAFRHALASFLSGRCRPRVSRISMVSGWS